MKNFNCLEFIAAILMLISFVIDLLALFITLPFGVEILPLPLILAAIVLYVIVLIRKRKK